MSDRPKNTESQDTDTMPVSMAERIRAHPFIAGTIAAAVVLVVGIGFAMATGGGDSGQEVGLAEFEPIESENGSESGEASTETDADKSSEATEVSGSDGTGSEVNPEERQGAGLPVVRAAAIAYRLDGALWVSAEDGSNARKVATVAGGAFTLSPDGKRLAYVDDAEGVAYVVEVSSATRVKIGAAEDIRPAWSPDSLMIAYTSSGQKMEVRTVRADGSGQSLIGAGHTPSFSRDGKRIAFIAHAEPGQVGNAVLIDVNGENGGGLGIKASEIIWGGDGLVFAINEAEPGKERIVTTDMEGSSRELAGASDEGPVMYAALEISPDGKQLLYAAHGDDGYSRTYTVPLSSAKAVTYAVRRDTYPQGWSSDSRRVFFVEGNAFQGEPTNLMSALTDGFGRVEVVTGAGL